MPGNKANMQINTFNLKINLTCNIYMYAEQVIACSILVIIRGVFVIFQDVSRHS